jgi:hypothetical protein
MAWLRAGCAGERTETATVREFETEHYFSSPLRGTSLSADSSLCFQGIRPSAIGCTTDRLEASTSLCRGMPIRQRILHLHSRGLGLLLVLKFLLAAALVVHHVTIE